MCVLPSGGTGFPLAHSAFGHWCKTIFTQPYSLERGWDLTSESLVILHEGSDMLNPQTPQCSLEISDNSWHFTARKGKTPPCCSFHCSFQRQLSQSVVHSDFSLSFSSVRLTPASSCGVATPRTPISAKQRKGLRWTGPCVHQER